MTARLRKGKTESVQEAPLNVETAGYKELAGKAVLFQKGVEDKDGVKWLERPAKKFIELLKENPIARKGVVITGAPEADVRALVSECQGVSIFRSNTQEFGSNFDGMLFQASSRIAELAGKDLEPVVFIDLHPLLAGRARLLEGIAEFVEAAKENGCPVIIAFEPKYFSSIEQGAIAKLAGGK